jgi:dTDP-4-dehydrorhamnose reductase
VQPGNWVQKNIIEKYPIFVWVLRMKRVSLDNLSLLKNQLDTISPDIILNCGAYTLQWIKRKRNRVADIVNHQAVKMLPNILMT